MRKLFLIALLIAVAAISGCVNQTVIGNGISIAAQIEPERMYSDSTATLYLDVENHDISAVDATTEVFNTGILEQQGECREQYENFLPREIKTLKCQLKAPSSDALAKQTVQTNIDYRVIFSKLFSVPVTFGVYGYEEFAKQKQAGLIEYESQMQTFADPNLRITVEFSKQPPFVARETENVFMYIKIRSQGSGFLQDINQENFIIEDYEGALDCDFPNQVQSLVAIKGEFPPITCKLNLADEKNYLRNFIIIIKYNYNYEIRGKLPVTVIK